MWGFVLPGSIKEKIGKATTLAELQIIAENFSADIGFDRLTLHLAKGRRHTGHKLATITNYPLEWVTRYDSMGYAHSDPVHARALKSDLPFIWSEVVHQEMTPMGARIFNEASDFNIFDGLTVPIHDTKTIGVFSALANGTAAERREALAYGADAMTVMAMHIQNRIRVLELGKPQIIPLTARELEILQLIGIGKTNNDISDLLKISAATIKVHCRHTYEKLGVSNRSMAAARAQQLGLVQVA